MAAVAKDNIADCVKEKMHKIAQEKGGKLNKKQQKAALGKAYGICRSDSVRICDGCRKEKPLYYQKLCKECYQKRVKNYVDKYDMDEDKLRKALAILERETVSMNSLEKETYFRAHLMPYFATGMIKANKEKLKIRQDASIGQILGGGIKQKLQEKKERSIFFKPFRPLETLHEITETAGKNSSSNVIGMEYSDGMLKVTFNWEKLGEVEYGYDVGLGFYERMAKAPSKGKFVWSALRGKSPGYVIDNPAKKTPGGVGGSIVPYTKITKRKIQGKEFKKLQKHYAGMLKGKVKVVAHMPFVRKKQKILSRKSKPFKKVPDGDFVLIKISSLSDLDVEGHYRNINGKQVWIPKYSRAGEAKKAIVEGIRSGKIKKTPLPKTKSQLAQEKAETKEKVSTQRRAQSSEEKRRRETEKQARGIKAIPAPEPREAAIQNLIEETGLERKEAEKQIAKRMGLTPEQAKKKAETKQREETFKAKHKELGAKLTALNELNKKIQSAPLKNLLKLLLKGFMLMATGKDAKVVLNKFKNFYGKLQKEKKLDQNQKKKLLLYIFKIHKEMEALSTSKKDFEYISAAVDQCAKRKVAQSGGKGNYRQYVAECIRIIGISRRSAGLSKRSGGTASEVRRGQRRVRMQRRSTARRTVRAQRSETMRLHNQAVQRLNEFEVTFHRQLNSRDITSAKRTLRVAEGLIDALRGETSKVFWENQFIEWQEEIQTHLQLIQEEQERRITQQIQERREAREGVRSARQRRIEERVRRNSEAISASSGANESEARSASEVIHIQIPEREPLTPAQYSMLYGGREPPVYALLNAPAGTQQTRRGYWTQAGVWRNPVFRTAEQISLTRASVRQARARRSTGSRISVRRGGSRMGGGSSTESASAREARARRRSHPGPKIRWRTRITFDGRSYNSLQEIKKSDLRRGQHLELNPIAKKDYDFVNTDFNPRKPEREGNRRRIQIRKGESAGRANFDVRYHERTGNYIYLSILRQRPDFRGRGASSILKPAIMWADSQNLIIGGSPGPIGRDEEVAPAHLTRAEQMTWAENNSRDLDNFYRKLEGEPNWEYGGSFARFPHPERIGRARSSDLVRSIKIKLDSRRKLIFFKNPKVNIAEIGGYHFYYDPEKDLFYQLDTE
ncbi:hypothetical protein LCGC14_0371340 [marine sediment metagenome]|uniref:Uncharacterized protein n=1 Tax=marine sediment metagenome TaxID=412755 RepID=A0A0F9TMY5_9ZZZZ|nr:hypothetical protein [bacterium]